MHCQFCGKPDTKVVDSRVSNDGDQVRRRRECIVCKQRFTTFESAEIKYPFIIKKNNSRVPYNSDKLLAGFMRALEKRPVTAQSVHEAIGRINHKLLTSRDEEVPSHFLGELVMQELKDMDEVAFIRFASVYRKFEDVNEFLNEIERLKKKS